MSSVGIIGAGIAGLITGKVLQEDGFSVTLLTRDASPGGTWAADRIYPDLKVNSIHGEYRFSCLPMAKPPNSEKTGGRLTGELLRKYFEEFTNKFLEGKIHYGVEVLKLSRDQTGKWLIRVRNNENDKEESLIFDKIVLCSGGMSNPMIPPKLSNTESRFQGLLIHSAHFNKNIPALLKALQPNSGEEKRKNLVIIGGGKSAQDIATHFANQNIHATVVCDTIDMFLAGPAPLPNFLRKSRFFGLMTGNVDLKTRFERFLHDSWLGSFMMSKLLAFVRWLAYFSYGVPKGSPLFDAHTPFWSIRINDLGVATPDTFPALVLSGMIDLITRCRATSFGEDGRSILLNNGRSIPADVVVLATGYKSSWEGLFDDNFAEELGIQRHPPTSFETWPYKSLQDPPPFRHTDQEQKFASIYRGIVPVNNIDKRDFAINGAVFTINPPYFCEAAAHWISSYFLKDPFISIPSKPEAFAQTERAAAYSRQRYPGAFLWANESYSSAIHFLSWPQATDELLEDMGLPGYRSGGNWLTWPFKVLDSNELQTIGEERRHLRERN